MIITIITIIYILIRQRVCCLVCVSHSSYLHPDPAVNPSLAASTLLLNPLAATSLPTLSLSLSQRSSGFLHLSSFDITSLFRYYFLLNFLLFSSILIIYLLSSFPIIFILILSLSYIFYLAFSPLRSQSYTNERNPPAHPSILFYFFPPSSPIPCHY